MATILPMNGQGSAARPEDVTVALANNQLRWMQYFEVMAKGLVRGEDCPYCKGADGKPRGYLAVNFVTPPKEAKQYPYYQLQLCRCASIPEGMDPNLIYRHLNHIEQQLAAVQLATTGGYEVLYKHTFWGFFVWLVMNAYGLLLEGAARLMEWIGRKQQAADADQQPAEPAPEAPKTDTL